MTTDPNSTKKKRELTELEKKFLSCLMDDEHRGNIRKAMKTAGYAATVPSSTILRQLNDEIIDLAKQTVAAYSGAAVFATIDVMEEGGGLGASNKLAAAKSILDRAGINKKDDQDINLKVPSGGLVILPAKEYDKPDSLGTKEDAE